MIIAGQILTYDTTRIGYTHLFYPPSALIHGDLWVSFIVLDRGDLELLEHIGKSFSQLMVTQA